MSYQGLVHRNIEHFWSSEEVGLKEVASLGTLHAHTCNLPRALLFLKSASISDISFCAICLANWKTAFNASSFSCLNIRMLSTFWTIPSSTFTRSGYKKNTDIYIYLLFHKHINKFVRRILGKSFWSICVRFTFPDLLTILGFTLLMHNSLVPESWMFQFTRDFKVIEKNLVSMF